MEILVVDRQPMSRDALRRLLASSFDRSIVHVAADLKRALELARSAPKIDFALLDLDIRGQLDAAALSHFSSKFPTIRVVVISAIETPKTVRRALENGAAGYVLRSSNQKVISAALHLVVSGAVYVPGELFLDGVRAPKGFQIDLVPPAGENLGLTARQTDVLRLVIDGHNNKEIAKHLSISLGTVKQHVHTIHDRLGTSNRAETIVSAMRRGFSTAQDPSQLPQQS